MPNEPAPRTIKGHELIVDEQDMNKTPDNEQGPAEELEPTEAIRDELGRVTRHPRREVERLNDVADEGAAGSTPFIEISRVFLFLVPIFLLMLLLAYGAYRLIA